MKEHRITYSEHTTTVDGNGKAAGMSVKDCRNIAEEIADKTKDVEQKYRDIRS